MTTDIRAAVLLAMTVRPGLTVAGLARLSGVHRVQLSRWLSGSRKNITTATEEAVMEALGLHVGFDVCPIDFGPPLVDIAKQAKETRAAGVRP
jgi:transcriptional regulator with XRE-family HTH domain